MLLDNFITASTRMEYEARLEMAEKKQREQQMANPLEPLLFKLAREFSDSQDLSDRLHSLYEVRPLLCVWVLAMRCCKLPGREESRCGRFLPLINSRISYCRNLNRDIPNVQVETRMFSTVLTPIPTCRCWTQIDRGGLTAGSSVPP